MRQQELFDSLDAEVSAIQLSPRAIPRVDDRVSEHIADSLDVDDDDGTLGRLVGEVAERLRCVPSGPLDETKVAVPLFPSSTNVPLEACDPQMHRLSSRSPVHELECGRLKECDLLWNAELVEPASVMGCDRLHLDVLKADPKQFIETFEAHGRGPEEELGDEECVLISDDDGEVGRTHSATAEGAGIDPNGDLITRP